MISAFSYDDKCASTWAHDSGTVKKIINAAKPPEQSKGLGGNIGCEDKNSTWH